MAFTKEQEAEGRRRARELLARGPVTYDPVSWHSYRASDEKLHTEDTLWPYCVPADVT